VDGFGNVDFALFSDREIDPTGKPNVVTPSPPPSKPISEQGDPKQDDSQDLNSTEDIQEAENWIKANPETALVVLAGLPQITKK
jgi:hypothetical protein